jgi:hypothetical protein
MTGITKSKESDLQVSQRCKKLPDAITGHLFPHV